ncbi:hydroxypyruvate isomerase family protein [Paracoccus liaowanqingii]|uniref:Hydroxypyruvate isomerase family protein n=1 Tax=Paracoccus liaowanqingii TaxID=2560053 RepID=A0A4Z1BL99_9RHOB|nr:2-oxo-tetronate isomerase [Paracoccus liaowanqingii]TGN61678.1 hydroxypyruvate isomerase family protein [Paracoccus liaowanqingii]
MTRIAANLSMLFTDAPFLDRFDRAGAAGFQAVEFLFPYDHPIETVKAALDRNGLSLTLINAPAGDWAAGERGFAARPAKRAEFEASVAKAVDYAAGLGCPRIHVMSGIVADEPDRDACEAVWSDNMRLAADMAGRAGLAVSVEPLNTRDVPGYFLAHQDPTLALIAALDRRNVLLQFDVYHTQIMDGDIIRRIERLRGAYGHVQIAGVPDRHEPDSGELAYPQIFAAFDRAGFDGWLGCEYNPRAGTEEGLGWAAPWLDARP